MHSLHFCTVFFVTSAFLCPITSLGKTVGIEVIHKMQDYGISFRGVDLSSDASFFLSYSFFNRQSKNTFLLPLSQLLTSGKKALANV